MTLDELRALLKEVLDSGDDVGKASDLLNTISEAYGGVLAQVGDLETQVSALIEKNTSLVEANGKLFMQIPITRDEAEDEVVDEKTYESVEDVVDRMIKEKL